MRLTPGTALLLVVFSGCDGDDTNPTVPNGGADAAANDASVVDAAGDSNDADTGDESDATADAPFPADAANDGADGNHESDSGLPKLSCTTWRNPTPVVLETLTPAYFFNGALWVGPGGTNHVRAITQPTAGTMPAFRIYDVDKTTSSVTTLDGPSSSASYASAHHFTDGASPTTRILIQAASGDGSNASTLSAFSIPDSMPLVGPAPSPIRVSAGGLGVAALTFSTGDVFAAVASDNVVAPPEIDYALRVGLASPSMPATLSNVALSPHDDDFTNLALAHANGNVYVFATNAVVRGGESAWVVPDTGVVTGTPAARAFDTAADSQVIDLGPSLAGGSTNFAYVSAADDAGTAISVRVGQVADSRIAAATSADLAAVRTYDDPSEVPGNQGRAQWSGDDIMLLGPAVPQPDGGVRPGANLLWVNARGTVRAEEVGANAILQSAGGNILSIVAAPVAVSATSGQWDVVWVEETSTGETLFYNELDCQ